MTFFPPDVSLRVDPAADINAAQKLFPAARQLLFRALNMKQAGMPMVKLFMPGTDGSLIHVHLIGDLKIVYVQPAPPKPEIPEEPVTEEGEEENPIYIMLNGVVRPGTLVDGSAHEFHPTAICADVYSLDYAYQDMKKLGVDMDNGYVQSRYPKPSQYSGAMKRIVQSMYGIGKTKSGSIAEDLAGDGALEITNPYLFGPTATHGLIKTTDGDGVFHWWLIEISTDRGVLKMELPFIPGTDNVGFSGFIDSLGDSETLGILTEFGGLPSGETFPDGADLEEALRAGTVRQLASADDLQPFYYYFDPSSVLRAKAVLHTECGWAFCESGEVLEAHNTALYYDYPAFVDNPTINEHELLVADSRYPLAEVAPISKRAAHAEHWKIVFSETTATLVLVESGFYAGPQKVITTRVFGIPDYERVELLRGPEGFPGGLWGRPPNTIADEKLEYFSLDCPLYVFFIEDELEVVRHCPQYTYSDGFLTGFVSTPDAYTSYGFNFSSISGSAPGRSTGAFGAGLSCTTTDSYFPPPEAEPGAVYRTEAASTGVTTYSVTMTDAIHGADFTPCSGASTTPDVLEYSVSVLFEMSATGQANYSYWAFKGTQIQTVSSSAHGIGYGDNSSTGIVDFYDEALSVVYGGATLHFPHAEVDVEGRIYDIEPILGPTSEVDNSLRISGWDRRWANVKRRAGAFYSSSADLRRDEEWSTFVTGGYYPVKVQDSAEWEQQIGLAIPRFTREAALYPIWNGGRQLDFTLGTSSGGFPYLNLWVQTDLPMFLEHPLLAPRLADGVIAGDVLDPFDEGMWVRTVNSIHFHYEMTLNAGPTQCGIVQDVIYADIILPPFSSLVLTPAQSFTGSANGIPVDDCTAINATYVGAV